MQYIVSKTMGQLLMMAQSPSEIKAIGYHVASAIRALFYKENPAHLDSEVGKFLNILLNASINSDERSVKAWIIASEQFRKWYFVGYMTDENIPVIPVELLYSHMEAA